MKIKGIDLFYALTLVFETMLVFYNLLPSFLVAAIVLLYIVASLYLLNKTFDKFYVLILTSISIIPISFISIVGTSTNAFPISWFHIIVLALIFYVAFCKGLDRRYLSYILIFLVYGIVDSIFQPSVFDGIKQVIMIVLFLLSFIIGEYVLSSRNNDIYSYTCNLFLLTCIVLALQIIIQFVLHRAFGIQVGYLEAMAGRIAYAGLLSDFSFATLYLASGFVVVLIKYFDYREIDITKFAIIALVLLLAILMTSARTGLYALALCVVLYFIFNIDFKKPKKIQMIILICGVMLVPIVLFVLMKSRGGQGLFDGSGRSRGYAAALKLFLDSPIIGSGFGLKNLTDLTKLEIPHNYFIQYLSQAGIVGTLLITLPIIQFVYERLKFTDNIKYVFILIVIGAMAIPDIVCSRFFYAIIILSYLSYVRIERGELSSI